MEVVTTCKVKTRIQDELLQQFPSVKFRFCPNITEATPYLTEVEILITYGEDLTEEYIHQAKSLKWIMVLSAGIDKMPLRTIHEKGIIVTNARGIHGIPMSEFAIAMLLQAAKQITKLWENKQNHSWDRQVHMTEITGKTMLIAGTGAIGQEVARLAKAFRMKVIGVSRSGRPTENFDEVIQRDRLLEMLPEADFVLSILPKTKDTKHFFQKEQFAAMKESALFLNMGRGDAVCEQDLIEALEKKTIAHAILDVFEKEPLDADHPLWELDNVTISPHISAISKEYQSRAMAIFKENLAKYIQNDLTLTNRIDPSRGY